MFSVALIGPDGAGKTTIARRLEHNLPRPVKYVYMGVSRDSSNVMLPITRLIHAVKKALGAPPDTAGPPDPARVHARSSRNPVKRFLTLVRSMARLANRLSEEGYRQYLAWTYQRQGYIVLFDRHFYSDYYAYDIASSKSQRPLANRIHGFFLDKIFPKPDLVIYLDAPGEVLFQRKGEGSVEALERRRGDYLQLRLIVLHFEVVDATQTEDAVLHDVRNRIETFYRDRYRDGVQVQHASD